MRLHLICFPHTQLNGDFSTCAYSMKCMKFAQMGWDDLVVYTTEGDYSGNAEFVELLSSAEREAIFGANNPSIPPAWPEEAQWELFNRRAAVEVSKRSEPGDLLLLQGGYSQHSVALNNPSLIACEPGVGYEGVWANFAAFESYAWQHFIYGKRRLEPNWDGRWFDRVIPNYFDVKEFPVVNDGKGDYLLFVGRVVQRKGLQAAADLAKAVGMKLLVAGPGPTEWKDGEKIVAPEITIYGNVYYQGTVGIKERNELMAGAYALLAPTVYVEPFGGVAVEAMLSGTPVISSDWGAFTETVIPGTTGYRFRTLAEGVAAVEDAGTLPAKKIRAYAKKYYSLQAIKPQFERWFDALSTLNDKGWYQL